jgi:hypothetical protein
MLGAMNGAKVITLLVGALTVAIGGVGILAGLGFLPKGQGDPTIPAADQQAVAICVGVVFAAGGLAAMLTTLPGRVSRILNGVLGLVVIVGLTSLFAWVAIGPGSRGFASPLAKFGPAVNEVSGRFLFGVVALMGLAMAILIVRSMFRSPTEADAQPMDGEPI